MYAVRVYLLCTCVCKYVCIYVDVRVRPCGMCCTYYWLSMYTLLNFLIVVWTFVVMMLFVLYVCPCVYVLCTVVCVRVCMQMVNRLHAVCMCMCMCMYMYA